MRFVHVKGCCKLTLQRSLFCAWVHLCYLVVVVEVVGRGEQEEGAVLEHDHEQQREENSKGEDNEYSIP